MADSSLKSQASGGDGQAATNGALVAMPAHANGRAVAPYVRPDIQPMGIPVALHSVRRRWPQMIGAGVVCAAAFGCMAWFYFQPKFVTYAALRIHSETPRLAFEVNEVGQASQFEVYKRTQKELVLGDEVLLAALREPKLAESPIIKLVSQTEDPVVWLRKGLRVDFPGDAEIMSIRMEGDSPKFLADAVNAVLDAYVENVINVGKQHRSDRLAELRKVLSVQEEKGRRLRSKLESLITSLGSGDSEALSVKQQVAIQRFAQTQAELSRVQFERLQAELRSARLADQLGGGGKNAAAASFTGPVDLSKLVIGTSPKTAPGLPVAPAPTMTADQLELLVERDESVMAQQERVYAAVRELESVRAIARRPDSPIASRYALTVEHEKEVLRRLKDSVRGSLAGKQTLELSLASQTQRSAMHEEQQRLTSELKTLEQHEKILSEKLAEATQAADSIGTSSINVELTRKELERVEQINDRIGIEIETLTIELSSGSRVEPLSRAREPRTANKEERAKKTVVFGVLGFLLPCAGLLWMDGRRKLINSEVELQQLATLRLLGSVPIVSRNRFLRDRPERGALAMREAVDRIRTVLIREAEGSNYRAIQITSAISGEAKTTFACQLATSLARAHRRTVLVDFDLRCPSVHEAYATPNSDGVCEVLRGERTVEEVMQAAEQEDLWRIHAGRCDRQALAELTKDGVGELLLELREHFEFVIVDTSPVLPVVDSLLVSQWVDAVIITALRDVSRAPQLQEAEERLRQVGANVLGSVVTTGGSPWYYQTIDRYSIA